MIQNYNQLRTFCIDELEVLLTTLAEPVVMYWPGVPGPNEPPNGVWTHLRIRQNSNRNVSLAGTDGQRRSRTTGSIFLQVNHPNGRGDLLRPASNLAIMAQRSLTKLLRQQRVTVTESVLDPVGAGDIYYVHLVTIRYEYDEVF